MRKNFKTENGPFGSYRLLNGYMIILKSTFKADEEIRMKLSGQVAVLVPNDEIIICLMNDGQASISGFEVTSAMLIWRRSM